MPDFESKVRSLSSAKALALAMYGESVASYRYRLMSEKVTSEKLRRIFTEMADEEQGHHTLLQAFVDEHLPGGDFVLSPADKELVIVGPRMLEITDRASFESAMKMIYDSERQTGRFYATWRDVTAREDMKTLLQEMSEECFDHAERLKDITPE